MLTSALVVYFIISLAIGYMGRDTLAGPVGCFLLSVLFTPFIAFFFLLVTGKVKNT